MTRAEAKELLDELDLAARYAEPDYDAEVCDGFTGLQLALETVSRVLRKVIGEMEAGEQEDRP